MEVEPIVEARLGQVDEIGRGDGHPWDCKKRLGYTPVAPVQSFIHLSIHLSICPILSYPICLSAYLSVCLSIYLSIYLSLSLSLPLSLA